MARLHYNALDGPIHAANNAIAVDDDVEVTIRLEISVYAEAPTDLMQSMTF